jgi:hypothetical protein
MKIEPRIVAFEDANAYREICRRIAAHKFFEIFILICIMLNTVVLSVNWYDMEDFVNSILDYGFVVVFAFEAIIKLLLTASKFISMTAE